MTATGLANVKVGDTLILVTNSKHHDDEPVTVTRVGRKYLNVTRTSGGYELREKFHIDTGHEVSQYSARQRLYTPEQRDDENERHALRQQLRDTGIDFRLGLDSRLTVDQLRALLAAIQPTA
ncbi:beta barrel domain-containing protein [Streptomyces bauhiniae]